MMASEMQKMQAKSILWAAIEGPDRRLDVKIGEALGWRVSSDSWWNWKGHDPQTGPKFDPPGDEWCIRRDARSDRACNEGLPEFTFMVRRDAEKIIDDG